MTPDASILICVRNRAELTRPMLDSLFATLPADLRAETLVYDDRSTDGTPALLASFGDRLRVVRGDEPGCFGSNMNSLARLARGQLLVLLNNDMIMRPGWLEPMLDAADRTGVGVVGNLQVYPGTATINHAGGAFERDLTPVNLYEGLDASLPAASAEREMKFVTAACWVADAALFKRLDGFDPVFRNGYEDADLCLRMLDAGQRVWYCGRSVVEHHGNSTPGRFARQSRNRSAFLRRWRGRLEPDLDAVTSADGVAWPNRSPAERAVRRLVRVWPLGWLAERVSNVPGVQSARGRLRRAFMLSRSEAGSGRLHR